MFFTFFFIYTYILTHKKDSDATECTQTQSDVGKRKSAGRVCIENAKKISFILLCALTLWRPARQIFRFARIEDEDDTGGRGRVNSLHSILSPILCVCLCVPSLVFYSCACVCVCECVRTTTTTLKKKNFFFFEDVYVEIRRSLDAAYSMVVRA